MRTLLETPGKETKMKNVNYNSFKAAIYNVFLTISKIKPCTTLFQNLSLRSKKLVSHLAKKNTWTRMKHVVFWFSIFLSNCNSKRFALARNRSIRENISLGPQRLRTVEPEPGGFSHFVTVLLCSSTFTVITSQRPGHIIVRVRDWETVKINLLWMK